MRTIGVTSVFEPKADGHANKRIPVPVVGYAIYPAWPDVIHPVELIICAPHTPVQSGGDLLRDVEPSPNAQNEFLRQELIGTKFVVATIRLPEKHYPCPAVDKRSGPVIHIAGNIGKEIDFSNYRELG